jgi:replicative DNA helicase
MIAEQTENQVFSEVVTACDHLVGNLYFNLPAVSVLAGILHPDDMPDCDAKMIYTEMCRLHISPTHKLSAGTLEAALKAVQFDFKYLGKLQSRIGIDGLDVLEDYARTINNWANVQSIKRVAMQVVTDADKPGVTAEQLYPMLAQTPQVRQVGGLRDISEYGIELLADIDDWQRGTVIEGMSTGFAALERFFRLERQRLYLIAARPSMGKCLGKGTKVLMYDGTLKAVEDVQVGDQLMGPDSTPRNVLSLARGREMMYWIRQKHGVDYRVNESHILSLKRSKNEGKWRNGDVYNVPVSEIKDKGPGFFHRFKGYKAAVDFLEIPLPIEPYFFGLWLGDGCTTNANIYNTDIEVISHLHEFAESRQEYVRVADKDRACRKFLVTGGRTKAARDSSIQASLNRLGVLGNKHIPEQYLRNSKSNRLQLLAGLIDSDGHYLGNTAWTV